MANGLVPDITPFAQGVGGFISEQINRRLQEKALAGDQPALARLSSRDPRGASQIGSILRGEQEQQQQVRQQEQQILPNISRGFVQAGDKKAFLASTAQLLRQQGMERLAGEVEDDFNRFDANPDSVISEYETASVILQSPQAFSKSVGQREFESLISGLSQEDQEKARRIKVGLDPRASLTPEEIAAREQAKADVKLETVGEIKARETRGKSKEVREQGFIDSGIEAADTIATTKRAIELLDLVETGGSEAASLQAKQIFGIETADEGELANALGIAVLQQLKPIFGSAFTAAEGERLERLSAGFRKSPAANKRILQQQLKITERAAKRALRLAEQKGDDFTAEEIRAALGQLKEVSKAPAQEAPQGQRVGRFVVEVE